MATSHKWEPTRQSSRLNECFEHRKAWVAQRIELLAACFAIAVHAYAVMSNHLHLVVQVDPAQADHWGDGEAFEELCVS
ncbi:MAG: hypothetical protein ACREO3_10235 [Arenimonas sp.]